MDSLEALPALLRVPGNWYATSLTFSFTTNMAKNIMMIMHTPSLKTDSMHCEIHSQFYACGVLEALKEEMAKGGSDWGELELCLCDVVGPKVLTTSSVLRKFPCERDPSYV